MAAERAAEPLHDPSGARRARSAPDPPLELAELVEAAARSANTERAAGHLARLAEIATACGTEWALGIEARSRALVSEGEAAERLYRTAIEHLARTRIRVAVARAHLLWRPRVRPRVHGCEPQPRPTRAASRRSGRGSCFSTSSLPTFSGLEVARRIRSGDGNRPAVVLTSTREGADLGSLVGDSGARGFIGKSELSGIALRRLVG